MQHAWLNARPSVLPAQWPLAGRPLKDRRLYPESLGLLTQLAQYCVLYCVLPSFRLCAKKFRAATSCQSRRRRGPASSSLTQPPPPPPSGDQSLWDEIWAGWRTTGLAALWPPAMCIYCKFVHINLCVLRKRLSRGLFFFLLASAVENKTAPTERRSLITVQKAIDCTIGRLRNCLLQPWRWGNSRRVTWRPPLFRVAGAPEIEKQNGRPTAWLAGCTKRRRPSVAAPALGGR